METERHSTANAWQPLTFSGVAAFAQASSSRVWFMQLAVAALVAACAIWFFCVAWQPSLDDAVAQLPARGLIQNGVLQWTGERPLVLGRDTFISIAIIPSETSSVGQIADLQCEFLETHFRVHSLLGFVTLPYPRSWTIPLNRGELEPWWGAWRPAVVAGIGLSVIVGLLISWQILSIAYALPVRCIALYGDRKIGLAGSRRLAVAALMPGALLMAGAIIAYGFHEINLIQLLFAELVHFAMGWIYAIVAPFSLPRRHPLPPPAPENPFQTPAQSEKPQ